MNKGIAVIAMACAIFCICFFYATNKKGAPIENESDNTTFKLTHNSKPLIFTESSGTFNLHHHHHFIAPEYSLEMDVNDLRNEHMGMTGGIAVADINNDFFPDIFVLGGNAANKLFLNQQGRSFKDITNSSKIPSIIPRSNSAIFADVNNDGLEDLLIGKVVDIRKNDETAERTLLFFSGERNLTFRNDSATSGLDFKSNIFSMSFSDFDKDGDVDLSVGHFHSNRKSLHESHLMINNGQGVFSPPSSSFLNYSNIAERDFSFTPIFSDINNDGWQDLLFAGDFDTSQYFLNRLGSWFSNETDPSVITDENGMGAATGDFDNDGDMDWFVSAIHSRERSSSTFYQWGTSGNKLYENTGNGQFRDISIDAGIEKGSWGWGSCMADFDLDGYLDIFHTNGFIYSPPLPPWLEHASIFSNSLPRLFINQQDGTFQDNADTYNLKADNGRAISCTDFDRDGDVDLLIQQHNDKLLFYTNNASDINAGNFIGIKLEDSLHSNHGVGSRITVRTGNKIQSREIQIGSNFLSQNAAEALFGLGQFQTIDEIKVHWGGLDGPVQTLNNVKVNQWLKINRP